MISTKDSVIKILKGCGVGILATDTIYGIVGFALDKKTVERIYKLRKRNKKKPMIVLIGDISDLKIFGVTVNITENNILKKVWPGKVSVVLPCLSKKFKYLHCGTKNIAFRLPKKKSLRELLKQTGPLVAPSANLEGKPRAKNIKEAKKYFANKVDFYLDNGTKIGLPSKLIKIVNGTVSILR